MDGVRLPIHRHPLNLSKEFLSEEGSGICGLCPEKIQGSGYECSECNFSAHLDCAKKPPSLVIDVAKIHEHPLTLFTSPISFTCNACGLSGNRSPYVCLKCSFIIHKECIDFPSVIRISRHHHRISHAFFLGPGEWVCGVCRKKIDGRYGAYSCSRCPNYAVHSGCARRKDVWDGTDLEGIGKEKEYEGDNIEDIEPFHRIDEDSILHISHQHSLRRLEDRDGDNLHPENARCSACAFHIASECFYRCEPCDFFLHERCAYVPQRMTTPLHVHPLTLCKDENGILNSTLTRCDACDLFCSGFRYQCLECEKHVVFDIQCSSIIEPFQYQLHAHPLYFTIPNTEIKSAKICNVCDLDVVPKCMLSCISCEFSVCFACATLPSKVKYKYDEHMLSHTIVEDAKELMWCDLCETKLFQERNHYKCSDCGPVIHTECLLGSFRKMRLGMSFALHGHEYQVVLNDRTSPQRCNQCGNDSHEPLLLISTTTTVDVTSYLCSSRCFITFVSDKFSSVS